MTLGFRILNRQCRVSKSVVEQFKALPVANVSDAMWRLFSGGPCLRPYHGGGVLAGAAITVKVPPCDNLMLHKAIDMAEKDDIIVVDAAGVLTHALMGELMLAYAAQRKVGGFVINGAIRDSAAFLRQKVPVYAAGISHRGPYKHGPGEINVPISLGGMVVNPGDLILGDADGVLCVPITECDKVYEAAKVKHESEARRLINIASGMTDRDWVDDVLVAAGCEYPVR